MQKVVLEIELYVCLVIFSYVLSSAFFTQFNGKRYICPLLLNIWISHLLRKSGLKNTQNQSCSASADGKCLILLFLTKCPSLSITIFVPHLENEAIAWNFHLPSVHYNWHALLGWILMNSKQMCCSLTASYKCALLSSEPLPENSSSTEEDAGDEYYGCS